jgi:Domain of unknown function (DUF4926)
MSTAAGSIKGILSNHMRFKRFEQVALARDIPDKKLQRGALATIVDVHPKNGDEVGYSMRFSTRSGTRLP